MEVSCSTLLSLQFVHKFSFTFTFSGRGRRRIASPPAPAPAPASPPAPPSPLDEDGRPVIPPSPQPLPLPSAGWFQSFEKWKTNILRRISYSCSSPSTRLPGFYLGLHSFNWYINAGGRRWNFWYVCHNSHSIHHLQSVHSGWRVWGLQRVVG